MQTQSVQVQHTFSFPAARIFKAWTGTPELQKWWMPASYMLQESNTEVKTGGAIDYRFQNANGDEARLTGSYRDVQPDALLDYDWEWETAEKANGEGSKQHIVIRFEEAHEGCKVTVEQSQEAALDKESVQHSWEEAMQGLQAYLAGENAVS